MSLNKLKIGLNLTRIYNYLSSFWIDFKLANRIYTKQSQVIESEKNADKFFPLNKEKVLFFKHFDIRQKF